MQSPQPMQTFFITNICRLEAIQKQYLSHNDLQSYSVFLPTSISQRLSHNVFLTSLPLHIRQHSSHNVTYTRNLSVLYKYPEISQIRSFRHSAVDQTETSTLHTKAPRRKCCINIQKYLKMVLVQTPVISTIFGGSKCTFDVAYCYVSTYVHEC